MDEQLRMKNLEIEKLKMQVDHIKDRESLAKQETFD